MKTADITDPLFLEAVEAIDSGDVAALEKLITQHPELISDRLSHPVGGYFSDPYLLWFVADNPIRNNKLPANIVEVTRLLIRHLKKQSPQNQQEQLDYTLGLVATGRLPRECGVQIELIDLLVDEGAKPGGGLGAIAHGNIAAAERLIERGGILTLAVAIVLGKMDDVKRLTQLAQADELVNALTAAAFYGKADIIAYLLRIGADPNGYPAGNSGFHSHATPLHQAVYSGSLDSVKLLVEAGADLHATDKAYSGTPLGWALYMPTEDGYDDVAKANFNGIAKYLQEKEKEI